MEDNIKTDDMQDVPTITIEVGKTQYEVGIHFNNSSKETMESKIKRLLRQDVRERLSTF